MHAAAVRGIDPREPWCKAAGRVIRTRLKELLALAPWALASGDAHALHDLRIAAKRLRYILELTDACYGESAQSAARLARELQDLAGAIHDHDLLLERIATYSARYIRDRAEALADEAGPHAPPARASASERATCAALGLVAISCAAKRQQLLVQLRARFDERQRAHLKQKLLAALDTPAPPARRSA
jgi:CHAD domain-containing protein